MGLVREFLICQNQAQSTIFKVSQAAVISNAHSRNTTLPWTRNNTQHTASNYNTMLPERAFWLMALAWAWAGLVKAQNNVRINLGAAKNYTDLRQRVWRADPFTIGLTQSVSCAGNPIGTIFDPVYCKYRFFTKKSSNYGPYLMNVTVPQAGQYNVILHFSETVSL